MRQLWTALPELSVADAGLWRGRVCLRTGSHVTSGIRRNLRARNLEVPASQASQGIQRNLRARNPEVPASQASQGIQRNLRARNRCYLGSGTSKSLWASSSMLTSLNVTT